MLSDVVIKLTINSLKNVEGPSLVIENDSPLKFHNYPCYKLYFTIVLQKIRPNRHEHCPQP